MPPPMHCDLPEIGLSRSLGAAQVKHSGGRRMRVGMADRVRAFDWGKTYLGPIHTWPQSIRSVVELVLAAQLPTVLLWGQDRLQIYNDAQVPLMGIKHPAGLGQPLAE